MKRSGEQERHDWISSRKFFPTPKKTLLKILGQKFHFQPIFLNEKGQLLIAADFFNSAMFQFFTKTDFN